ncbi:MAG TPA: DUF3131 domain-containing protein [Gemmatimonadaceae bacterium]|nr:DUF3131 domain-containing protein [Gemmatimonadaceae bacterium]
MSRGAVKKMRIGTLILVVTGMTVSGYACGDAQESRAAEPAVQLQSAGSQRAAVARTPLTPAETAFYQEAARLAWRYMETNYQPATGFVNATPDWQYTTIWDVGAQLLAFHAAKELGIITQQDFDRRTTKTLNTLERVSLFRGKVFNKTYSARDASMGNGAKDGGTGWSATDLGRLLIALKVLATREPQYAAQAERIVRRNDFDEVVKNGYLHGQLIGSNGQPWTFQEGRIGYEQYMAAGFDMWGAEVDNALNLRAHGRPVKVLGVEVLLDTRWNDRLLSEPFYLLGMELGLTGDMRDLATNVLKAQETRFTSTGQITIATEDAVGVPPHYFYYYCVYCNRKPFVIDIATPGREMDSPRWVSTKGAFGWHAVMPSAYTQRAQDLVARSRSASRGWASGVYEKTSASTETYDINTAAVILEAAAFQLRGGRPHIQGPVTTAQPPTT